MSTVTGQCDHIVGIFLSPDIQEGGMDRLVHASEHLSVDERFDYCPCCGSNLEDSGIVTKRISCVCASSMNCDTSISS